MNHEIFSQVLTNFFINNIEADSSNIPEKVIQLKEIVEDFFGEDKVELQPSKSFGDGAWSDVFSTITFGTLCEECGVPTDIWFENSYYDRADNEISGFETNNYIKFMEHLNFEAMLKSDKLPFFTIIIKFENITISNERDESTNIEEMFARIDISPTGKIINRPFWIRTIFSYLHFISHYSHSHLPTSSCMSSGSFWKVPCLGSGPIVMTINNLQEQFQPELWPLLCRELDVCIRAESLNGGPYIRISDIQKGSVRRAEVFELGTTEYNTSITPNIRKEIILRTLNNNKLKWVYRAGHYELAHNFCEMSVLFTQVYLDYLMSLDSEDRPNAEDLLNKKVLFLGQITENYSIIKWEVTEGFQRGKTLNTHLKFKGDEIWCRVLPYEPLEVIRSNQKMLLLEIKVVSLLHKLLLLLANSLYGRK